MILKGSRRHQEPTIQGVKYISNTPLSKPKTHTEHNNEATAIPVVAAPSTLMQWTVSIGNRDFLRDDAAHDEI